MTGALKSLRAANDNLPLSAEFERIPEMFLDVYRAELMGWAANLMRMGPQLKVALWNRPGATLLDSGYQPEVTLRCDALKHPVSGALKMVIQPATEVDAEVIAKHCEVLPGIMQAQRAAAQADRGRSREQARWVFDGTVPDYFVLRYQDELRAWARNLPKIGMRKNIILREGSLADISPDPDMGAQLIQVQLKAKVERLKGDELQICASAADERSEMLIRKHCEKMERNRIPALVELVEPERPGIPFMPDKVT